MNEFSELYYCKIQQNHDDIFINFDDIDNIDDIKVIIVDEISDHKCNQMDERTFYLSTIIKYADISENLKKVYKDLFITIRVSI